MIRYVLLASVAGYVAVGEFVVHKSQPQLTSMLPQALGIATVAMIMTALVIRRLVIARQVVILAAEPENPAALSPWKAGYLVIYAMAEAICLYGMILRITGATLAQSLPFYVVGILMLVAHPPLRPRSASR